MRGMLLVGKSGKLDVIITEVGGTVGDMESQPFLEAIRQLQWELPEEDLASIHCYQPAEEMQKFVDLMKTFNRPIFCTEYLARPFGSTFETVLPVLKKDKVAAYDFGLVRGAMQCHYEWNKVDKDGNKIQYTEEPDPWFHDIFQPDGTPYRPAEVAFIKSLTGSD